MCKLLSSALTFFAFICSLTNVLGQVATGTYPYGTFDSKGFDTINVANLNTHFSIPVLTKPSQRLPFYYNLSYDSSVWFPTLVNGNMAWVPVQNFGWLVDSTIPFGFLGGTAKSSTFKAGSTTCHVITYSWSYYDSLGTQHPFPNQTSRQSGGTICNGGTSASTGTATDGSGYSLAVTNWQSGTITTRSGATINPATTFESIGSTYDSNGNYVSVDGSGNFTDTTGNVVLKVTGTAPSAHTFTYVDTGGTSRAVSMTYTSYTVQTAFGCSGVGEYGPVAQSLVDSVTYPDGSAYHFTYEATPGVSGSVTGRIATVKLPQTGVIRYSYNGTGSTNNGIVCADGSTQSLTRTLDATANSATSVYQYTRTPSASNSHTEVSDGLTNHLAYDFVAPSNPPAITPTAVLYETKRSFYQGTESGTPVIARQTCYNYAGNPTPSTPCSTGAILTLPIAQLDTYETLDGVQMHGATAKINVYGMQTESDVYDYNGISSRGNLLEKQSWTYANASIPSLVTEQDLYDGLQALAGKTTYGYDGGTLTASSGVPHHIAVAGARGNLTSKSLYSNSSTSYAMSATYEDTGSILTSVTPNGTSSYGYDSSFVYQTSQTMPTPSSGVAIGIGASYDMTYTGVPLTTTDPNGVHTSVSSASYDSMLRPTEIDYPDGGKTTMNYYSDAQLGVSNLQETGFATDSEVQFDDYNRKSRQAVTNGQTGNGYYQNDFCYDGNSNLNVSSYAYQGAGWGTAKVCSSTSGDTYNYDVLGRLKGVSRGNGETVTYTYKGKSMQIVDENLVTHISQVDGLGRTTSVCEIWTTGTMVGNSGSATSCGADLPGSGYSTTYAYSLSTGTTTVIQGTQTRTFQSDWLGRPVSVTEPESGTTSYGYAYSGNNLVVTRKRPKANQTNSTTLTTATTQYDSLNRVTSIVYDDGTGAKTYTYDSPAGWSNFSQSSLKGRMSSAHMPTGAPWNGADTLFSYDTMGRTTGLGECLPTGCGNASLDKFLSYTYNLAGNMIASTDGAGVTSTYAVTVANELSGLTSSKSDSTDPANLISRMVNGPNGPISYSLGNGLSQFNGYDAIGRFNQGSLCTGAPTANCSPQRYSFQATYQGTQLKQGLDSVTGQNNYQYDEFNRLSGMTSTSNTALYSYTYDRWGNRWAQNALQGGTTASFSFDTAKNHINTSGYSYDAAGNVTNDGFHTYTYDAEGNITAVDSGSTSSYVYNALNQRVHKVLGNAVTEFLFNSSGQRVSVWTGSTETFARGNYYWGMRPVGYYQSGSAHFQHQDWLGTVRLHTNYSGTTEGSFPTLPFGDGQTGQTNSDPEYYAMLDFDSESTTDHAQFRQYSMAQGRWMRPDPYSGSYVGSDPQSFNRYSYVENMPLSYSDPKGTSRPYWVWQMMYDGNQPFLGLGGGGDNSDEFDMFDTVSSSAGTYTYSGDVWDDEMSGGYGGGVTDGDNGDLICSDGSVCGSVSQSMLGMMMPLSQMPIASVSVGTPSKANPYKNWPLNGTLLPYTSQQDQKCTAGSVIGPLMDANPGMSSACQWHDNEYTEYNCNMTSWVSPFPGACTAINLVLLGRIYDALPFKPF